MGRSRLAHALAMLGALAVAAVLLADSIRYQCQRDRRSIELGRQAMRHRGLTKPHHECGWKPATKVASITLLLDRA